MTIVHMHTVHKHLWQVLYFEDKNCQTLPNENIWRRKKNYKQVGTYILVLSFSLSLWCVYILLINILRLKIIYVVALLASIHKITRFGTLFSAHKKKKNLNNIRIYKCIALFCDLLCKIIVHKYTHLHLIYTYIYMKMLKRVYIRRKCIFFVFIWCGLNKCFI